MYATLEHQGLFGELDEFWTSSYARYSKIETLIKSSRLLHSIEEANNLDEQLAIELFNQNREFTLIQKKLHEITAANLNDHELINLRAFLDKDIKRENILVKDAAEELHINITRHRQNNNK